MDLFRAGLMRTLFVPFAVAGPYRSVLRRALEGKIVIHPTFKGAGARRNIRPLGVNQMRTLMMGLVALA
jgi:hypothetical protein